MDFKLLGPLEVRIDEKPVGLTGSRQEIVLSLLLLDANRVVSVDRIIDALWAEKPPRTARSQVQIIVAALRKFFGKDILRTRPPGYLIEVLEDAVDLRRFEKLIASGELAVSEQNVPEAVRYIRQALKLWRGPALDGIQSESIRAVAIRLNESRIAAMQGCLDLELQLGRHGDLIGELTELVVAYPLDERFRGQLMMALYRSGRQPEALATFRAGRDFLQEELGLDPSAELRALEQAVLSRDERIDLAGAGHLAGLATQAGGVPVPRQLPRTGADFAGRERLLEEISAAVCRDDPAASLEVPVVVLTGIGGAGKTALAVRAAHMLSRSFPDGQLFLHHHSDERQSVTGLLQDVLRSLGVPEKSLPSAAESLTTMYRSSLAGRRILIVIDGAWSMQHITPFLPGTSGCAAIVTTTHRFTGLEGVRQLEVGPLDDQSAMDLLASVAGAERVAAEQEASRELIRLCAGLPLALRIVAAKVAARPHLQISRMVALLQDESRRLDELDLNGASIRATLTVAYESLELSGRCLLRRLAMLGTTEFAAWVGAPLIDTDIDHAEELLQKLVESHLVEANVTADDSVRYYLHDLVRIFAVERLADEERASARIRSLQRLLSCWLSLAVAAHSRIYGGDFAVPHGNAPLWPLRLDSVDALLRKPGNWFRTERSSLVEAIFQAARLGMDELCWDLAVTTGTLFETELFREDWRDTHAVALDAVRQTGNRRGEGVLLHSLGMLEADVDAAAAHVHFEDSLKILGAVDDKRGCALARTGIARLRRREGKYDLALSGYNEGLAEFRAVGDLACEAHTLMETALIHADRRDYQTAESMLNEAQFIVAKLGGDRLAAQVLHALGELKLRTGHPEAGLEALTAALRLSEEAGDLVGQSYSQTGLGNARRRLGDLPGAESTLHIALDLADSTGHWLMRGRTLLALAELEYARGRDNLALARIDEAIRVFSENGTESIWHARVLELLGRVHERAGRISVAQHTWETAAEWVGGADLELAEQLAIALGRLRTSTLAVIARSVPGQRH